MVPSKIGDGELNLGRKLRVSYIDQLVLPQIFKYLIGAKDVEVRLACRFDWHDSIVWRKNFFLPAAEPQHVPQSLKIT